MQTIANKYARAFLNIYGAQLSDALIKKLDEILVNLSHYKKQLYAASILSTNACNDILKKMGINVHPFDKLAALLIEHQRIHLLPIILQCIRDEYKARMGSDTCVVKSSEPLTEKQKKGVQNFIEHTINKKLDIEYRVDKNIIAGIKIITKNMVWQHSIDQIITSLKGYIAREYREY